jgi:hypothetical protein
MGMIGLFWPFAFALGGAMFILSVLLVIFWIWMLVDCAKRNFKNHVEKIVWIVVVVLLGWIGALAYFIVIRSLNRSGLAKK